MLAKLEAASQDTLWKLTAEFRADPREQKMDLVIGVYRDEHGNTPVMAAVRVAEQQIAAAAASKSYRALVGNLEFNDCMARLLLGQDPARLARSHTIQTVGGTGALRLLADFIAVARADACVWISDPGYINHLPIMKAAGLKIDGYRWQERAGVLDVEALLADLSRARSGDVVLLHGCCHNPTGIDMPFEAWQAVADLCAERGLVPLVDMAYQGLGEGMEEDAAGLRLLVERLDTVLVAASCSKNMGLYCERTGAALVVGESEAILQPVGGILERITRCNYSMPPDHGATVVARILADPSLTVLWETELAQMRQRIIFNRKMLGDALLRREANSALQSLTRHKGMFSMLPFSADTMDYLRVKHAIYGTQGGRINIAGLASRQIERLAGVLAAVSHI